VAESLAYLNWGRWVAECAAPDCHDAMRLTPGDVSMRCVRGHVTAVQWPGNAPAIADAVANRAEKNRNWFPEGHPLATAVGWPTGQTVEDLHEETRTFAPELGTLPIPDEDAEAIDRILHRSGLALTRDLKHVREL
jgi:hypothetical protein